VAVTARAQRFAGPPRSWVLAAAVFLVFLTFFASDAVYD
jgi:hypothetical protein